MNSIKKNLFHNIIYLLSNIIFPLISFSYASKIIGPEGFGKVQFVLAFTQYFILFAALGIPILGVREIAKLRFQKEKLSKLSSELLLINIISTMVMLLLYLLIISSFHFFKEDFNLFLLGGIIVLAGFSSIDWFYNGMEEFYFLSIRSIIIKSLALISLFIFVHTKNDLIAYFLITVFSITANNLWNLIKLKKFISFRFSNLNYKQHIPALLTIFATSISISIYTLIDTLFLGFFADDKYVGFYTAALRLNKTMIPLIIALGVVLIPRITQSLQNNDQIFLKSLINKSFAFICLLGIPISMGLYIFAEEFILSISGPDFSPAILTMQITAPLGILIGLGHLFGFQLLIPAGLEKKYLYATIVGMLLSVVLNILLIPLIKDKGTAIATLAGEIMVTFISFYYVIKYLPVRLNWNLALKSFLICLLFIPIAYLLRYYQIEIVIRLIIAILSCAIFYFTIQLFVFKEESIKLVVNSFTNYFFKK